MLINPDKRYCYRICHIDNLRHLLNVGMCSKYHPLADPNFVSIGNIEVINARDTTDVQIAGYGKVGEYVPFYFTPRSIMLYNIVTGHRAPKVPKVPRENILVIRCLIEQLAKCGRYFFTDGQANVSNGTNHFHDLKDLDKIDWSIIQTWIIRTMLTPSERPEFRMCKSDYSSYSHASPADADPLRRRSGVC